MGAWVGGHPAWVIEWPEWVYLALGGRVLFENVNYLKYLFPTKLFAKEIIHKVFYYFL